MTFATKTHIATAADIILKNFEITTPITDIDAVVARLGGRLEPSVSNTQSGEIERVSEESTDYIIKLADNLPQEQRNVAAAQALGHVFLHQGYLTDWEKWDNFTLDAGEKRFIPREFEANEFALNFLMPKEVYAAYAVEIAEDGNVNMQKMADYFKVPLNKAISRGQWLGVTAWS